MEAWEALLKDEWEKRHSSRPFTPGVSYIPTSGKVVSYPEVIAAADALLRGVWTADRYTRLFEKKIADITERETAVMVNSGSSANYVAFRALSGRAPKNFHVMTSAIAFPSTVWPIVEMGFKPLFLDVDLGTLNTTLEHIENAYYSGCVGVVLAHTLGNPLDAFKIRRFCDEHNMFFLEDACDALGSWVDGHPCGSWGHAATISLYPAHPITAGEGGVVLCNENLEREILKYRDWGRDCYCLPGKDNTCGKRFSQHVGGKDVRDHKYCYSALSGNFKATDIQAAIAYVQTAHLASFVRTRRLNTHLLQEGLKDLPELILPSFLADAEPSLFGFAITIARDCDIEAKDMCEWLESKKIGTRPIFAGNIMEQPMGLRENIDFDAYGYLRNAYYAHRQSFWVGVWPGITIEMINYMIERIREYVYAHRGH